MVVSLLFFTSCPFLLYAFKLPGLWHSMKTWHIYILSTQESFVYSPK